MAQPAAPEITPAPSRPVPRTDAVSTLVAKPWFWILLVGFMAGFPLARALTRQVPKPPALHLALPPFKLTDQKGEPFGLEDLKGRVWVADFIFTSCGTACPKLTKRMSLIQHRARNLGDAFHLVSFTVDPENDTPERLAAYARTYHADSARWSFLTGSLADVETTVIKGFKIAMGKEGGDAGGSLFSIFHGEKIVLVDIDGAIRGYYDADDEGQADVLRDIDLLINAR